MLSMLSSFVLAVVLAQDPDPLTEAQDLYSRGSVAYEAADYDSAIDLFTQSLNVTAALPEDEAGPIKLQLLYNIARAHEKAFDIDKDAKHLRQALALYKRYASEVPDTGDTLDAEYNMTRIEKKLRLLDQIERNKAAASSPQREVPSPPPSAPPAETDKKKRNVGIGLLSGGAAFTVTGIAVLAAGARLRPQAEQQVNDVTGGDMSHEAWEPGQAHIASETKRGRILMGVGGGVAALGVAGVVVGAVQLKKSKQRTTVSAYGGAGEVGLILTGRF